MSSKRNDIWNEHQLEAEYENLEACIQCKQNPTNNLYCDSCRNRNEAELIQTADDWLINGRYQ